VSSLEVIRTGPLSLIEDLGRAGYAALGVGLSGAADRSSYAAANALLGNDVGAAAVECLLGGLSVTAVGELSIAVTGAPAPITIDGGPADHAARLEVADGQVVKLGTPKTGLRSYLAVAGGIVVPEVLGSRSRDTLSGIGPEPLRRGDSLPIGIAPRPGPGSAVGSTAPARSASSAADSSAARSANEIVTLRAMLGPRANWFSNPGDLASIEWIVSPQSNRVGLRLDRVEPGSPPGSVPSEVAAGERALRRKDSRELASEGLALGSVQVPPSGQPVLFLADHPVTGGYPVVAVVLDADVDQAAQFRPGQHLRFELIP